VAKGVLGTDSVDAQLGDGLPAEVVLGLPRATIDQAASAATVILLTGDVREELPILFLRLRSAAVDGDLSLVELSPQATSLTEHAAVSLRYGPGDARALVDALVADGIAPAAAKDADAVAEARRLIGEGPVVVVVGRPSLAEDAELVADAARALADALPEARFVPALRRGNVLGALDMGLAPGLLPGRVTLEDGRAWFEAAWGAVPQGRGRGTADILAAAAGDHAGGAPVTTLVLLGSDPLSDFPDRRLARRALEAADFVVAVATAPGDALEYADVVLPAAEAHERPGTTTNIEGRISRLGQKLVPPGQAWPDWMIAGELAVHLGHDLGFDSVGTVWDEIEQLAVSHRGITRAVLDSPGCADGVVAPLGASPVSLSRRAPLDPMAVPGVESVERQGAGLQAGLASSPNAGTGATPGEPDDGSPARPPLVSGATDLSVPHVSPADGYSVRLVASRVLYDSGSAVEAVPALAGLVTPGTLRANPQDLDELGVAAGGEVRLRSATATLVVPVEPDGSLPRKVVAADVNVPLGDGTVGDLIDRAFPVVDLRMESL
jgi:NADH-quinone oxidoreductase subunit G